MINGDDDGLIINGFGACAPSPCEWGEARGSVFADGVSSKLGLAFSALYDFGFKETWLQAKVKKGVLVVANLNMFNMAALGRTTFPSEFFLQRESQKGVIAARMINFDLTADRKL